MDLRYPIGKWQFEAPSTAAQREQWIRIIAETPARLSKAVAGLDDAQLDTPYREGGWTVRQVVHHVVDSHINSYVRYRLALTETKPTIKPYDEAAWATLADARTGPVELSLALLEALHTRWVILLNSLGAEQWLRTFIHPEQGEVSLEKNLAIYAWHGPHHVAHITALRDRRGW